jgi:hypothetical protein
VPAEDWAMVAGWAFCPGLCDLGRSEGDCEALRDGTTCLTAGAVPTARTWLTLFRRSGTRPHGHSGEPATSAESLHPMTKALLSITTRSVDNLTCPDAGTPS